MNTELETVINNLPAHIQAVISNTQKFIKDNNIKNWQEFDQKVIEKRLENKGA